MQNNFDLQPVPLKIYIQDIYRAERMENHKYIYKFLNMHFKNISIHGIVTELYNSTGNACNFELTDPTASIQVYYDTSKSNNTLSNAATKRLHDQFYSQGGNNLNGLNLMFNAIIKTTKKPIKFELGDYVAVIGDIFIDDLRSVRNVSAFDCHKTSLERDVVWLEELYSMYEKYYLWEIKD